MSNYFNAGGLGLVPLGSGGSGGSVFDIDDDGNWYQDWGQGVINQAGSIITSLWGRNNNAGNAGGNVPGYGQPQLTADQYAAILAAQQQQSRGVGFGFDGQGLRLSDGSHIGWTTIAVVVGAFFLLQSPGFSRRR